MVRIKICGITNIGDAEAAVAAGADALGFVFFKKSPRYVSPEDVKGIVEKIPPFLSAVGVFVNEEAGEINRIAEICGLDVVQLHGDETPAYCEQIARKVVKALRVRDWNSLDPMVDYRSSAVLLDSYVSGEYGGTGHRFNWEIAREAARMRPVILSGGLHPGNVAEAVAIVRPYAVDVSSGVESDSDKRRKDPRKMKAFIDNARAASAVGGEAARAEGDA